MKTNQNIIELEDANGGMSVQTHGVEYTDETGTRIYVPMKLVVHLYELAKYDLERQGYNWLEFTDSLFPKQDKFQ